jgi:4-aminobutyrate aminotransferase
VIIEPIQGESGIHPVSEELLNAARQACDRHGALLVFDEIQCGFGRTGRMWACEHDGVTPDLMTVGKGIGGGLAVSAVVGRETLMRHWPAGTHTSTFMGNAVNLAAGHAAITVMRDERLWERAARLASSCLPSLDRDLADTPPVGEVRGLGLLIGIEIVADRTSRRSDPARLAAIRSAAFERGLLVGACGPDDSVLKICPPLTIDERQFADALGIVVEVIKGA